MRVSRDQALAHRLAVHHLDGRLPAGSLLDAAGVAGIHDAAPGAAIVALHARVLQASLDEFHAALYADRTLLRVFSATAAPFLVPTRDLPVFTRGLRPADESGQLALMSGVEPALAELHLSATEVVSLVRDEIDDVLGNTELTKDELSLAVAERISSRLKRQQREAWRQPSWFAPDQRLGESVVRFALPLVGLTGEICCGTRHGRLASFVRTAWWLSQPPEPGERDANRAAIARRFVHAYGPTTREGFAAWAGISDAQAQHSWGLIEPELATTIVDDEERWLLAADLSALEAPPQPQGIRLLAPFDPYLLSPDRPLLVSDTGRQRAIWRSSGWPGVVLVDGELAGLWRGRQAGQTLTISITPFERLSTQTMEAIAAEADDVAPLADAAHAEVKLAEA